jgi:hypothetical protein
VEEEDLFKAIAMEEVEEEEEEGSFSKSMQ